MAWNDSHEQVFWHIAQQQAWHISNLLSRAFNYYAQGDLGQYFWTFTTIRDRIHQDLEPRERKSLDALESHISQQIIFWNHYKQSVRDCGDISEEDKLGKAIFAHLVRRYARKIMMYLKHSGYLPRKEDRTRMAF